MEWCRNPKNSLNLDMCFKWVCECGDNFGQHIYLDCPDGKTTFTFKHNDNCTLECQFKYKVKTCSKNC